MILYVSESGGIVTKEYTGTPDEETQNLAAAKVIADVWGCTVALLGQSTTKGTKMADVAIYRHGCICAEQWEIKTNMKGTKRSIENALRRANRQATRMFLHIVSNISKKDMLDGIKGQIRYTKLQEIAIIKDSEIEIYTRQDILSMMK